MREDAVGNTFARWAGSEPELAGGRHRLAHRRHSQRRPLRWNRRRARRTRSHPRVAARRLPAAPLHRTGDLHLRGAHALRHRMPRQPPDGGRARRRRRHASRRQRRQDAEHGAPPRASTATSPACACPRATTPRSSSCISSRVRCSNAPASRWASSPPSPRRPACAFEIEGEGGHAGAVLMPDRQDAFLRRRRNGAGGGSAAKSTGAIDTVGTVGVCEVFPGAVNSIPSEVAPGSGRARYRMKRAAMPCLPKSTTRAQAVAKRRGGADRDGNDQRRYARAVRCRQWSNRSPAPARRSGSAFKPW